MIENKDLTFRIVCDDKLLNRQARAYLSSWGIKPTPKLLKAARLIYAEVAGCIDSWAWAYCHKFDIPHDLCISFVNDLLMSMFNMSDTQWGVDGFLYRYRIPLNNQADESATDSK